MEKLVYGGDGLGRLDGRVILTPYVLPGEMVRVEAEQEKPGLVRARPLQVLTPSPVRVAAPCPYFKRCGGCHYQHAPYALQLETKRAILIEELRRIGKIEPPAEIELVAAEPWGYRNRAQFHVRGTELGYLELRSHRFCSIESCPISSPKLNAVIAILRQMLPDPRWPRFLQSLEVFTNEQQVQLNVLESDRPIARRFFDWCGEQIPGWVSGALQYAAAGSAFNVSPHSFFQVNRYLVDRLVELALDDAEGESGLELYAGVGLFSVPMARRFRKVIAVEASAGAVRDLRLNTEDVQVVQSSAEQYLQGVQECPEFVLLDPPRAGLGKPVVARLVALKPQRIAVVACDPSTLARDLSGLIAGGYRIRHMSLIDLFPQTFHMETVVHLWRANLAAQQS